MDNDNIIFCGEKIFSYLNKMLSYAAKDDNISLVDIQNKYETMKREQYLLQHNHKVWKAKDGKWKTTFDHSTH